MTASIKPMTPDEVVRNKVNVLPEFVIDTINTLITMRYDGVSAKFTQNELVKMIKNNSNDYTTDEMAKKGWLDFEVLYETYGWDVNYSRPDYTESYEPYFLFTKKKPRS